MFGHGCLPHVLGGHIFTTRFALTTRTTFFAANFVVAGNGSSDFSRLDFFGKLLVLQLFALDAALFAAYLVAFTRIAGSLFFARLTLTFLEFLDFLALAGAARLALAIALGFVLGHLFFGFSLFVSKTEESHQFGKEALFLFDFEFFRSLCDRLLFFLRRVRRGNIARQDVLDYRNLLGTLLLFLFASRLERIGVIGDRREIFGALITCEIVVKAFVIEAQAFDVVMRCFQRNIRDEHHGHFEALFDLGDFTTFFVEHVGGHIHRHLRMKSARTFLGGFFLQNAQYLNGAAFGVADDADAVATRTGDVVTFRERRAQSLA